ncbi:MAG TPA: hypothetical protein VKA08_13775 [Balneolales bacterium]|nr:hypothetical protein [Balneolales bacterium]
MKQLFTLFLCLVFTIPALAQEDQTLVSNHIGSGGFGGPVLKISSISGEAALFVGGRGGWIIKLNPSSSFVIGGGGYGLSTDVEANNIFINNRQQYVSVGYGGLELEYVHQSYRLVHFSLQSLIGAGSAGYQNKDRENRSNSDSFFVWEPGVNVLLNVTHFFRIGTGLGYRLTSGSHLLEASDSDLSGVTGIITFKFGKF